MVLPNEECKGAVPWLSQSETTFERRAPVRHVAERQWPLDGHPSRSNQARRTMPSDRKSSLTRDSSSRTLHVDVDPASRSSRRTPRWLPDHPARPPVRSELDVARRLVYLRRRTCRVRYVYRSGTQSITRSKRALAFGPLPVGVDYWRRGLDHQNRWAEDAVMTPSSG